MVVRTTNTIAASAPFSLFLAKPRMLLGFPSGWKFSPGENMRQIPVKDSSNSFIETSIFPLAGSLRTAASFLNPSRTTKWSKFQWIIQGNVAFAISACGSTL